MFQSLQELWVYLAEEQHFTDFNNSEKLVWHERGLKFGNWTDGPQMDGSRLFSTNIQASEVWNPQGQDTLSAPSATFPLPWCILSH